MKAEPATRRRRVAYDWRRASKTCRVESLYSMCRACVCDARSMSVQGVFLMCGSRVVRFRRRRLSNVSISLARLSLRPPGQPCRVRCACGLIIRDHVKVQNDTPRFIHSILQRFTGRFSYHLRCQHLCDHAPAGNASDERAERNAARRVPGVIAK